MSLLLFFITFLTMQSFAEAKLACESSEFCARTLREGSECVDGFCSNPFADGCFKRMLGSKTKEELDFIHFDHLLLGGALEGRVCNSDDAEDSENCSVNEFDYFEIRIHNSNWESSIFLAWIMQIMLMEVLKVPVTIGVNKAVTKASSFYSPVNSLEYSSAAYPWDALRVSEENIECENTDEDCVHILPEVWNAQIHEWTALMHDDVIDALDWCGQVGKLAWYIPEATAKKDNTLTSHYGLSGEENRAKLADTFRRPTTWQEYCEEVSASNCTIPDEVATHYPESGSFAKYFVDGEYTGYFRLLPENDCSAFPDTCTGYMVGPPCTWSGSVDAQLFWNNIVGLALDGPGEPNGSYGYSSMIEIWKASNATQSDVMMWWWQPEAMLDKFSGTGWGFQPVLLPTVTDQCSKNRVSSTDRCDADITIRRGSPVGACDDEAHALLKIISNSLPKVTASTEETKRSPGYPFVRSLKVNDLQIQTMLNTWINTEVDQYGNDAREAVCGWVVDNLDTLVDFIPPGHPRELIKFGSFQHWYAYTSLAIAGLCCLGLVIVSAVTHKYRRKTVFVYAQEIFVKIILLGFFLVIIGGILFAVEPTNGICVAREWLTNLGFSATLSAVLVKMSTINRIMQKSKKCKRVKVSRKNMFISLGILVVIELVVLITWTVVAPPKANEVLVLPDELQSEVELTLMCKPENRIFVYIVYIWHLFLLIIASVLSFQSRDIVPAFNESRSIGTMIYSNFLFMILRLIIFALGEQLLISPNIYGGSMTLLYALDAAMAMIIYIVPKCYEAIKDPGTYVSRGSTFARSSVNRSSAALHSTNELEESPNVMDTNDDSY